MREGFLAFGIGVFACTPPVYGPDASTNQPDSSCDTVCQVPSDASPDIGFVNLCPDDMVLIDIRPPFTITYPNPDAGFDPHDFDFDPSTVNKPFCLDRYEFPNLRDFPPKTGVSFDFAQRQCASEGKRLPTHAEWTVAAQGMHKYVFGYGDTYDKSRCNLSKHWIAPNWNLMSNDAAWEKEVKRLYQADLSGANEQCYSEWGNDKLWDMIGNAAEWTQDDKAQYGVAVMACSWVNCLRPEPASSFYGNFNHSKNFRSYEFGWRCMKDIVGH